MADGDREVLSSLPRTRPERRSAKRGAPAGAAGGGAGAATQPQPAAGRAKPAAKAKPRTAAPRTTAKPRTAAARTKRGPTAVPPRKVPRAGYAVPKQGSPVHAGGTELVGTAIQAVGELANLGASIGGRALRGVIGRLPKA